VEGWCGHETAIEVPDLAVQWFLTVFEIVREVGNSAAVSPG